MTKSDLFVLVLIMMMWVMLIKITKAMIITVRLVTLFKRMDGGL